jgi:UDP-N-acetylmuramyl pentapeptide phosphotransferase/UDP-N-acetylglucosamine-1-phosphate transferase
MLPLTTPNLHAVVHNLKDHGFLDIEQSIVNWYSEMEAIKSNPTLYIPTLTLDGLQNVNQHTQSYFDTQKKKNLISDIVLAKSLGIHISKEVIDAVEKRVVVSERPVGALLSGGLDSSLVVSRISFSFSKDLFYLQPYEIFFTILCFLLFMNAFNMYDGINLQSGLYTIYIFIIFFIFTANYFFLIVLIPLVTFLYLNSKNKIFLGNSGSYLIGFLISYFIIKIFNNFNNITSDKIFLLMLMPGFDMLRLFVVRLLKKKNPFAPDNDHFHHLLSSNYNFIYAVIINFFL